MNFCQKTEDSQVETILNIQNDARGGGIQIMVYLVQRWPYMMNIILEGEQQAEMQMSLTKRAH